MTGEQSGGEVGSPSRRMALAARLFRDGHPAAQCAEIALSAVKEEPSEANLCLLALYRLHAGRLEEAFATAERIRTSTDLHTPIALGVIWSADGNEEKATGAFKSVLEFAPELSHVYRNLAFHSRIHGRCREAVLNRVRALVVTRVDQTYKVGCRLPDDMPKFLCDRAEADKTLARTNPAWARVWEVCNAIEAAHNPLPPETIEPIGELGDLEWVRPALRAACAMLGDYKAASADLRSALKLSPNEPSLLVGVWQRGRWGGVSPSAARALRQLLRLHPRWLQGNVDLARDLYRSGRKDQALEHLDIVIFAVPGYAPAIDRRFMYRLDGGDLEAALEDVQSLIRLLKADEIDSYEETEEALDYTYKFERLLNRAEIYAKLGDTQMSDTEYERTLGLARALDERERLQSPLVEHVPMVLSSRASCYLGQKRYEEALRDFDAAFEWTDFFLAELLPDRATCKEALGDKAGAEEDRRRAAALRAEEDETYRRMTEKEPDEE